LCLFGGLSMEAKRRTKKESAKGKKIGKIIAITLTILLLVGTVAIGIYGYRILNLDTFYSGVIVDDVSLEGMSKAEALSAIRQKHQPKIDEINIVFKIDDKQWLFDHEDINANINIQEIVDEAYSIGREGTIIERVREI